MRRQPELILGSNKLSGIQKVFGIYGDIAGNQKIYNEEIRAKMKEQVCLMKGDPFFREHENTIWQSLTRQQKESLANFIQWSC